MLFVGMIALPMADACSSALFWREQQDAAQQALSPLAEGEASWLIANSEDPAPLVVAAMENSDIVAVPEGEIWIAEGMDDAADGMALAVCFRLEAVRSRLIPFLPGETVEVEALRVFDMPPGTAAEPDGYQGFAFAADVSLVGIGTLRAEALDEAPDSMRKLFDYG